ncbi:hypothetical protein QUG91_26495, partial [Klebsiella michiganensis]|uniref:hypothetical protein n=1 Tax=Klebsiella michiganensis TaxID=1134687 RepID=UPI0025A08DF7
GVPSGINTSAFNPNGNSEKTSCHPYELYFCQPDRRQQIQLTAKRQQKPALSLLIVNFDIIALINSSYFSVSF